MKLLPRISGENECWQKSLEATLSVDVLEAPKIEVTALATLPTLLVTEDAKLK